MSKQTVTGIEPPTVDLAFDFMGLSYDAMRDSSSISVISLDR